MKYENEPTTTSFSGTTCAYCGRSGKLPKWGARASNQGGWFASLGSERKIRMKLLYKADADALRFRRKRSAMRLLLGSGQQSLVEQSRLA